MVCGFTIFTPYQAKLIKQQMELKTELAELKIEQTEFKTK